MSEVRHFHAANLPYGAMARKIKAIPAKNFDHLLQGGFSPSVVEGFRYPIDYKLVNPEQETQETILNGTALVTSAKWINHPTQTILEYFRKGNYTFRACLVYVIGRGYMVVTYSQWDELKAAEGWPLGAQMLAS